MRMMWVRTQTALLGAAGLLVSLAASPSAGAAPTNAQDSPSSAGATDPKTRALKHFEHARELYRDGNYKEAIGELEAARELDPDAKDLVYNLALVNEKLGNIEESLRWMHRYSEMDLDEQERGRAESAIRRLEGAKRTLEETKREEAKRPPKQPNEPSRPPMGRIDGWTIATGSVAVVGLGVGAILGISALSSRPKAGFVTGQNGTYADLADQAENAHTKAIVADIGFTVFVASAVACSLLYFLRPRVDAKKSPIGLLFLPQASR
jgi:tetratricopeptide (TPR) repeat protein